MKIGRKIVIKAHIKIIYVASLNGFGAPHSEILIEVHLKLYNGNVANFLRSIR